ALPIFADHRRGADRSAQVLRLRAPQCRVPDGGLQNLMTDPMEGEGVDDGREVGFDPTCAHVIPERQGVFGYSLAHSTSFRGLMCVHSLPYSGTADCLKSVTLLR